MAARCDRPEHPNPLFQRETWMNLNGPWQFAICPEKLQFPPRWEGTLQAPFCLQSPLSGALDQLSAERKMHLGLHGPPLAPGLPKRKALWYAKSLVLPAEWSLEGSEVWLHVGACDSYAEVMVNGRSCGTHLGGNTPFSLNITSALRSDGTDGEVKINIKCTDSSSVDKPAGKQLCRPGIYKGKGNLGTLYSNITGIWQTVWLEARSQQHLAGLQMVAKLEELDQWHLELQAEVATKAGETVELVATLFTDRSCRDPICQSSTSVNDAKNVALQLLVPQKETKLWCPENPHLYGLQLHLQNQRGEMVDRVTSYAALRSVTCHGDQICLNGNPTFLRLVLDQGYYPDGLWTAPSSDHLRQDIVLAKKLGFNGARLHQKVFEPLYFAHADELGFLVFCEYPDWNGGWSNRWQVSSAYQSYLMEEWATLVRHLQNHPSILVWGIFNEFGPKNGWDRHHGPGGGFKRRYSAEESEAKIQKHKEFVQQTVQLVRKMDGQKRPIHDSSGWIHVSTDLWSFHDYEQKIERWSKILSDPTKYLDGRQGQPLLVGEFAGVGFDAGGPYGFNDEKFLPGYVQRGYELPATADEALSRIHGLTAEIYKRDLYAGYCFTQLYDVEYEKNGLLKYDRTPKFPLPQLRRIFDGRLQTGRWRKLPVLRGKRCRKLRPLKSRALRRLRAVRCAARCAKMWLLQIAVSGCLTVFAFWH